MKTLLIPMAGLGSRFTKAGFNVHKPLIEIDNKKLIRISIDSLNLSEEWKIILVARNLGESYKKEIEKVVPEAQIKWINKLTGGAAETAMLAENLIDKEDELIITNCDQYLDWNVEDFLEKSRKKGISGSVLTYQSKDPKNSFCRADENGKIFEIVEKKIISNQALVGLHWWRKGISFLNSARKLLKDCPKDKETYISETLQYLIKDGNNVISIPINGKYWSLGTPNDFYKFKGYLSEFHMDKPRTFFIDLDGTILKHGHRYSDLYNNQIEACPNVIEAMDELDSQGHTIILVSSRKESARDFTKKLLDKLGIPYDNLILGVSQGKRVIVNDIISERSNPRCGSLNVITNKGWEAKELLEC